MTRRAEVPQPPLPSHPMATRAFGWYLDRLARKTFASVRWRSETEWRGWDAAIPTLVVANHTSWWDGFLSHQVTRAMGHDFRILMQADNLARYSFFRRIGAMPIERRSAPQAMRDLESAGAALVPGTMLWIYPQGARRPAGESLSALEAGAAWLITRHPGPLRVLPVAFRYVLLSEQHPEAMISVGSPWLVHAKNDLRGPITADICAHLTTTVAELDARLRVESLDGFLPLVSGTPSINNRLDRVRHALGLLPDFQARNG
ncbi:MAG: lysophospholipid acyltransferase family protein [Gemmatimonadota bacterium]